MTQKAAEARARLYATILGKFFIQLRLQAEPNKQLAWRYNPEAMHCGDCKELDGLVRPAKEWYKLNLYPRSGQTECLMNCKCTLEEV